MRLLSLIFRVFEKRQYKRAYLKQMHESLKDYSERTLAVGVYHTPPAIIQPWKSPDKQTRRPKEYHTGQKNQTQTIVLTQVDQISPSTSRGSDYCVHNVCSIAGVLSQMHSVCLHTSHVHLQQIHVLVLQNCGHDHGRVQKPWQTRGNISSSRYLHNSREGDSQRENIISSQNLTLHLGS